MRDLKIPTVKEAISSNAERYKARITTHPNRLTIGITIWYIRVLYWYSCIYRRYIIQYHYSQSVYRVISQSFTQLLKEEFHEISKCVCTNALAHSFCHYECRITYEWEKPYFNDFYCKSSHGGFLTSYALFYRFFQSVHLSIYLKNHYISFDMRKTCFLYLRVSS